MSFNCLVHSCDFCCRICLAFSWHFLRSFCLTLSWGTQLTLSANSSTSLARPVQVSDALALDRAIHLMEAWPLLRLEHFAQNLGKLLTWWNSRTHRCGIRDNFWHIVIRNAVFLPQVMFSPCAMDFRFVFDVAKNLISANITSHSNWNTCGSTCVKSASIMTYHVQYHITASSWRTARWNIQKAIGCAQKVTGNRPEICLQQHHIYIYVYIYMCVCI